MAAAASAFDEFGPTSLEPHAGLAFDTSDVSFSGDASSMRFTEDEKHAYVDEHRFCGLPPLGRKGFTMHAFGHLGQERYDLDDEKDTWAAGAPNKADLEAFELWQAILGRAAENVPHEWIDPITLGLMRNPCRAADGLVYERAAIREWMQRQKRPTSPLTGAPLASRVLRPEIALQQRIRTELRLRGVALTD